jgi:hypothetical protein
MGTERRMPPPEFIDGIQPEMPAQYYRSSAASLNSSSKSFHTAHKAPTPSDAQVHNPATLSIGDQQSITTTAADSLEASAQEAMDRFWAGVTDTLDQLWLRSYYLYNASEYIGSLDDELILIAEARKVNADGRRTFRDMLISLKGKMGWEIGMFNALQEHAKILEAFDKFASDREKLLHIAKS